MPSPVLSVVIPTHKRASILHQCLKHLEKQTIADKIEVIVVSDGHDEETSNLFSDILHTTYHIPLTYFEIEKSQQGVARNEGVLAATAPLTLFIGDDIFLEPDCCQVHLETHERLGIAAAVLGYTTWDPSLEITPVMRWLEGTGWQFGYPLLRRYKHAFVPKAHQHRFTYTSHISVPTEMARRVSFQSDVTLYGWEDIEWGRRLRDIGIPLFYEPHASGVHHHHMTLEKSLARMETIGRSLKAMEEIDPNFDRIPRGMNLLAYTLLALLPTMRGKHYKALLHGLHSQK